MRGNPSPNSIPQSRSAPELWPKAQTAFTRGVEGQESFRSFTFPSNVSPYFPAKEWEAAKRTLPEDVFRQEYMAEFLEDSAGVFRGIDACLIDASSEVGGQ